MNIGDECNFVNQTERLVYLGKNFSGNGYWHQFSKVDNPGTIWAEILDSDMHMIEPSNPHS